MKDFFISYNKADEDNATWIAWQLEEVGYTVIIQAWDFKGKNFVLEMDNAAKNANQTIAVLSPDFLNSRYTAPEWAAAFVQDPTGSQRKLILVRVKSVEIAGLLTAIDYIDLVGIDPKLAKQKLLQGVEGKRVKPTTEPTPSFHQQQPSKTITFTHNHTIAEYTIGQLNRTAQYQHFRKHIPKECCIRDGKTFGFIVSGSETEWPVAIRFRLAYLVEKLLIGDAKHVPNLVKLDADLGITSDSTELANTKYYGNYMWNLLGDAKNWQPEQTVLQEKLGQLEECHIFYREVIREELEAPHFLINLLNTWTKLQLPSSSKSHFLLFICEMDNPQQFWQEQIIATLKQSNLEQARLPELHSPSYHTDVKDWIKLHIHNDTLRDSITETLTELAKLNDIPLITLKKVLKPLFEQHSPH